MNFIITKQNLIFSADDNRAGQLEVRGRKVEEVGQESAIGSRTIQQ